MKQLLKISEFAHLSGMKRKNLIYYDEIGLLSPEKIMENGYRVYSYSQLETVSVILALQELGVSLKEIKIYLDERTPSNVLEMFSQKRNDVEEKIKALRQIQAMIDYRLAVTRRALEVDTSSIEIMKCPREPLFVGDEIENPDDEKVEKAVEDFYEMCDAQGVIYGYPFSTMLTQQRLESRQWDLPTRFFYKLPLEKNCKPIMYKPAGEYVVGFENSTDDEPQRTLQRMLEFIKKNNFVIAGDAYEEPLLDEIAVKDPKDYLLQISILVKKLDETDENSIDIKVKS